MDMSDIRAERESLQAENKALREAGQRLLAMLATDDWGRRQREVIAEFCALVEPPAKWLRVDAGVRYWEDATVNGEEDIDGSRIPRGDRGGGRWRPVIEVDTGRINGWPQGTTASVHYKVCDDGVYTLEAEDGTVIRSHDGYVPDCMCPKEPGYGDYIIMDIGPDGVIAGWDPELARQVGT